jgi:hypothetical protein
LGWARHGRSWSREGAALELKDKRSSRERQLRERERRGRAVQRLGARDAQLLGSSDRPESVPESKVEDAAGRVGGTGQRPAPWEQLELEASLAETWAPGVEKKRSPATRKKLSAAGFYHRQKAAQVIRSPRLKQDQGVGYFSFRFFCFCLF